MAEDGKKTEAIRGFNAYIDNLGKENPKGMVMTLVQFDTQGIDILHDATPIREVNRLTELTFVPRGGTPLYDAMGKTIRATEAKVKGKYKVLFVTLTDGEENSSEEWTQATINSLIKEKESRDNWTFAHIGVGPQGWSAADKIAIGTASLSNVLKIKPKGTRKAFAAFAQASRCYAVSTDNLSATTTDLWAGNKDAEEAANE